VLRFSKEKKNEVTSLWHVFQPVIKNTEKRVTIPDLIDFIQGYKVMK